MSIKQKSKIINVGLLKLFARLKKKNIHRVDLIEKTSTKCVNFEWESRSYFGL